jgi:hypothetical protein
MGKMKTLGEGKRDLVLQIIVTRCDGGYTLVVYEDGYDMDGDTTPTYARMLTRIERFLKEGAREMNEAKGEFR